MAFFVDHHIARFDVAMDNALFVSGLEAHGNLMRDVDGLGNLERTLLDAFVEAVTLEEGHGQEGLPVNLADFVDGTNVRVMQGRGGLGFSMETLEGFLVLEQMRGEEFEGDRAVEFGVLGFVDNAHAPEIASGKFVLIEKAVWKDVGTIKFHIGAQNSGTSSVVALQGSSEVEVETTTIDNIVAELGLPRVDVLKLDIEGAEREALAGARSTLEKFRPRLLMDANHRPDDPIALPRIVREIHADYKTQIGPCLIESLSPSYVWLD